MALKSVQTCLSACRAAVQLPSAYFVEREEERRSKERETSEETD